MASLQAGHACTVRGATSVNATIKQPAMNLSHFMNGPPSFYYMGLTMRRSNLAGGVCKTSKRTATHSEPMSVCEVVCKTSKCKATHLGIFR